MRGAVRLWDCDFRMEDAFKRSWPVVYVVVAFLGGKASHVGEGEDTRRGAVCLASVVLKLGHGEDLESPL